jgi:hypothetical protein
MFVFQLDERGSPMSDVDQKVLDALSDQNFKWRTVSGVAEQVGVREEDVLDVISRHPDEVVQASVPSRDGERLFTTRQHFRETGSTFGKMIGAFKSRVR